MSSLLKLFFIAVAAFSLVTCSEKDVNPNRDLTLDDFSTMRVSDYVVSSIWTAKCAMTVIRSLPIIFFAIITSRVDASFG